MRPVETVPEVAPDMVVDRDGLTCAVYDLQSHRVLHVKGQHWGRCGLATESTVRTRSSALWLARLLQLKPLWAVNEVLRAESPLASEVFDYLEGRYHITFEHTRVLELGCGFGATAVQMLERGASSLLALDVDNTGLQMAYQRAADFGHGSRALFAQIGEDGQLPARLGQFNIVIAAEVFEHVTPQTRPALLRCLYERVAPGGVLLLSTPNRLVPKDLHTSGLWVVNFMPRSLAFRYARRFSSRCRGMDDSSLISAGLLSFSWWEARRILRDTDAVDLSLELPPLPGSVPSSSQAGKVWNQAAHALWRAGRWLWTCIPFDAVAGHLFLAFRRPSGGSADEPETGGRAP